MRVMGGGGGARMQRPRCTPISCGGRFEVPYTIILVLGLAFRV